MEASSRQGMGGLLEFVSIQGERSDILGLSVEGRDMWEESLGPAAPLGSCRVFPDISHRGAKMRSGGFFQVAWHQGPWRAVHNLYFSLGKALWHPDAGKT